MDKEEDNADSAGSVENLSFCTTSRTLLIIGSTFPFYKLKNR